MRKMMRKDEGFTLIELMIVILIIAILVAIAVPVFLAARANAQRRTCQSNLRTVDGAINTYNAEYDSYPPPGAVGTMLVTTLIKRDPTCPSTGNTYVLAGAVGSTIPPSVSCPSGVANHSI